MGLCVKGVKMKDSKSVLGMNGHLSQACVCVVFKGKCSYIVCMRKISCLKSVWSIYYTCLKSRGSSLSFQLFVDIVQTFRRKTLNGEF